MGYIARGGVGVGVEIVFYRWLLRLMCCDI